MFRGKHYILFRLSIVRWRIFEVCCHRSNRCHRYKLKYRHIVRVWHRRLRNLYKSWWLLCPRSLLHCICTGWNRCIYRYWVCIRVWGRKILSWHYKFRKPGMFFRGCRHCFGSGFCRIPWQQARHLPLRRYDSPNG